MKRIYISGPMAGLEPEEVTERFKIAEACIRRCTDQDWQIINPAEIYPGVDPDALDHEEWMRLDLTLLSMCDAIFMLPGWEESDGAREEHEKAQHMGLKVYGFAGQEDLYQCPEIEEGKASVEELVEAARKLKARMAIEE